MKFLCLHGMGTSAQIFKAQMAPITAKFEGLHEFVYVDGVIECEAADGVGSIFPGPYLCYYNLPTHSLVSAAHDFIHNIMNEDGPFDGVIGFSQGAALASSMMLQRAKEDPYAPPLFRLAIFAGASLPYNLDDRERQSKYEAEISETPASKTRNESSLDSTHGAPEPQAESADFEPRAFPSVPAESEEPFLGRYHPDSEMETVRITAPTLHLIGRSDQFGSQAILLTQLCGGALTIVHHNAGHELPNEGTFVRRATAAMEGLIHGVTFYM
ncbi:hypothetical protein AJ80_04079 [Polytolypa hystricis UAMH7299]|uniref:Serine hydrolase domain-containing protein n=1 Tax=Polytolypa hystricis (strain UAMH7299) TaxID=1447883 RepID=A0A2B7YCS3_POLH7|nr:hypothetical protein AJ80_04079 [Polytolypa hystricis UAMH7299]